MPERDEPWQCLEIAGCLSEVQRGRVISLVHGRKMPEMLLNFLYGPDRSSTTKNQ